MEDRCRSSLTGFAPASGSNSGHGPGGDSASSGVRDRTVGSLPLFPGSVVTLERTKLFAFGFDVFRLKSGFTFLPKNEPLAYGSPPISGYRPSSPVFVSPRIVSTEHFQNIFRTWKFEPHSPAKRLGNMCRVGSDDPLLQVPGLCKLFVTRWWLLLAFRKAWTFSPIAPSIGSYVLRTFPKPDASFLNPLAVR